MRKIFLSLPTLLWAIFTQAQQSQNISFVHDGKTVFGVWSTPSGTGPYPVIILTPGSGPNDRNGTIVLSGGNSACLYPGLVGDTLKPYQDLSDDLVDSGYAVLRYDKLEYTYPTNLGHLTFHKLWLPVESAIEYVKTRADADTHKIILVGHSEGSSLIPYIAQKRTDIKALISIAGPRTPFDSILAYQIVDFAKKCNGDTITAHQQAQQILQYFSVVRTQNWSSGTPSLFGVPPDVWYDYLQATDSVAENYNICSLPTLFLGLGDDLNVPPSELQRFQNEVTITNDFWLLSGLNHFMTNAHQPTVDPTVADTIIYWLRYQNFTDIDGIRSDNDFFQLFPNPTTKLVRLHFADLHSGTFQVIIRNTKGKIVWEKKLQLNSQRTTQLDLHALAPGMYFVEVVGKEIKFVRKLTLQ